MKRINVHLTESQLGELAKHSKESGIPVAEMIRRSIDVYLATAARLKHATRKRK